MWNTWEAWLVVAVLAVIGEVVTMDLFLVCVAIAAVVVAIVSVFLPLGLQVGIFAVLSLGGIAFVRPALKGALGIDTLKSVGGPEKHSHLEGKRAVVTQTINPAGGQIRIGQAEFWSARAFNPDEEIPVGTNVEIELVDGLTAVVTPVLPAPVLDSNIDLATQKG